jgi:LysM repeat protein
MSRDRSAAVWLGVALGVGVLFLALVQIRAWVFDLQARVEKVAEDNKMYQCKMEEALASIQRSEQQARAESPPSDKPSPQKDAAVTEEPPQEKVPTPKAVPVKTKTSTEPLRTYKVCYRIKKGENLTEISERFQVSVDELRHWNGLKSTDAIMAGHALDIYTTTTTDRLGYAASARVTERQVGRSVAETPTPARKEQPVSTGDSRYVVQPGENLHRIGRIHDMNWKSIADENGIDNPNTIYAGQVLKIPSR